MQVINFANESFCIKLREYYKNRQRRILIIVSLRLYMSEKKSKLDFKHIAKCAIYDIFLSIPCVELKIYSIPSLQSDFFVILND